MFTGLVEATGIVLSLVPTEKQARLTLALPFAGELSLGDSVAVNGCCLTVTEVSITSASFDILTQTLEVTSLGQLKEGASVNLERALRVGDRLGGHFMQGHVDGIGSVKDWSLHGQDHRLEVEVPPELHSLCIAKGSIAIDGISLTIAKLLETSVVAWITPHTCESTHLHQMQLNQSVNLEGDMLAKYVHAALQNQPK